MSVSLIGNNCCACRTCEQICSVHAISFKRDVDGYEQVCIDNSVCVQCGLCEKVCPVLNVRKPSNQSIPNFCGAALAKDDTIKRNGSSGGLFGVFAQHIIHEGGIVYGAAFDETLQLKTRRATTEKELSPLYKSKYLLCDTGDSFKQIKEDLKSGLKVLYCSTPCQIAGLQAYLRCNYDNLYCVEFVCHGVGNQQQFDQSIKFLEKRNNILIKRFDFRFKKQGYSNSSHYYYYYYGEKKGRPINKEGLYLFVPYYNAYCKQLICREICYKCPYATTERNSDLTIGDFHTISSFIPEIDRFKGVSMFVCNTPKGMSLFDSVRAHLEVYPLPWDEIKTQNRFSGRENAPQERETLLTYIREKGYDEAVNVLLNPWKDWKRLLYYNLPAFVRKSVFKIISSK